MRNGTASVRYEVGASAYEREAFVSAPDGVFVMHFRALGTGSLNVALELGSPHPDERYHSDERCLAGRPGARACRTALLGKGAGRCLRRRRRLALCRQAWPSRLTAGCCDLQSEGSLRVEGARPCHLHRPAGRRSRCRGGALYSTTTLLSDVPKTATYTHAYAKSNGFLTLLSDGTRLTGAYALGAEAGEWLQQATLADRAASRWKC